MKKNAEYQPPGVHDGPDDPPHQPHLQGDGGGGFRNNIYFKPLQFIGLSDKL